MLEMLFPDYDTIPHIFKDGALSALPTLFSVPEFIVRRYFKTYYPDENFGGSLNVLLLQKGEQNILIDAGLGPSAEGGQLIAEMDKKGIKPENITDVLLTHAHLDHSGGLLTKDGGRAYPNAKIYISIAEHLFWLQTVESILTISPELPEFLYNGTITLYKKVTEAYEGDIVFLNDKDEPFPGITCEMYGGHTPGHLVFDVSSGGKTLSYVGDTFFTRTTHVQNPEWGISADTFPEQAIVDRIALMEGIADGKKMTVLYHDDFPGLGYLVKTGVAYDFAPISRTA